MKVERLLSRCFDAEKRSRVVPDECDLHTAYQDRLALLPRDLEQRTPGATLGALFGLWKFYRSEAKFVLDHLLQVLDAKIEDLPVHAVGF